MGENSARVVIRLATI